MSARSKSEIIDLLKNGGEVWGKFLDGLSDGFLAESVGNAGRNDAGVEEPAPGLHGPVLVADHDGNDRGLAGADVVAFLAQRVAHLGGDPDDARDAGRLGLHWGKATAFADPPDKVTAKTDEEARARARRDHATSLVLEAGAGTGKTTLLVDRIESLVRAPVNVNTAPREVLIDGKAPGTVSLIVWGDGQRKQYDVVVQVEDDKRRQPSDLTSVYVRGNGGELHQLSNLVSVRETVAPKELNHFNRQRAAIISASVMPGYTLGEALDYLDRTALEVIGKQAKTELDGQSREFRESGAQLVFLFVLALVFIYLVLSAQFESFVSPFVIMLTVPLGVIGALIALHLSGGTLNVYSKAGLIMLIGLVTKNGILIVEFTNQLRDRGREQLEAVIEASALRLRPILMTSLATVLGAVPLALATGAGAESRQPIGWVIVGGVLLGTFLTLFIIPTFYTLLVGKRRAAPDEVTGGGAAVHTPANKA